VIEGRGDTAQAIQHLRTSLSVWENADTTYLPAREARARMEALGG